MDKVTRMLILYSRLLGGERINKNSFCLECDITQRSFDRDIEGIRLFLSESYSIQELRYDRKTNDYYITGCKKNELQEVEFNLLKRLLIDTRALRKDELIGLLNQLKATTRKTSSYLSKILDNEVNNYQGPTHGKAIIKMYGDLALCIDNKNVIRINYCEDAEMKITKEIIPCALRYEIGYFYLVAYIAGEGKEYPEYLRLDRIYSFEIYRHQTLEERIKVERYISLFEKSIPQMYGETYMDVIVECQNQSIENIADKFLDIEVISKGNENSIVKLHVVEDVFVKWLMSQPLKEISVLKPQSLRERMKQEGIKLVKKYK